ncbi:MurR/RpiR family transcriptional regulator [Lactobacillus helveticus]|uniref:MurR/RpiR family transcriptional regulator n=1 Tax=Lactobacillus helveticus TaxID=1587 RepID=UPI0021A55F1E|nr:MurR/RpiR family transcriptional regulator [Lactobacillus helveticus]MCT3402525.1 MurR/RpiR family transcriptional regulator [Lactobacillus helveticus]
MNILDRLKDSDDFTESEIEIATFILKNTDLVLHSSISKLAFYTYSSPATIVRFCKKLNCNGYKDFKLVLSCDFLNNVNAIKTTNFDLPFDSSDSTPAIARKIEQLNIDIISETRRNLDYNQLDLAVKILTHARKVLGIGVSDSFLRLKDFQLKLLKIGINLELIDYQAEQYHLANMAGKGDAAVIISNSGVTAEIVNDAQILVSKGADIIAVTSNPNSQLAKLATVTLLIPENSKRGEKISNISSQSSIDYVLNVLYSCWFQTNYRKNYSLDKGTPHARFDGN